MTTPRLAGEKYNGPGCAAGWNEVIDLFMKSISLTFANTFIRALRNDRFGVSEPVRNGANAHFRRAYGWFDRLTNAWNLL
jgi:hypothetical protein